MSNSISSERHSQAFWPFGPLVTLQLSPDNLRQAINPGWSFGNYIVNHNNSTAPGVEQAILGKNSYGRQIGQLMDVVKLLLDHAGIANDTTAKFRKLFEDVEKIKAESQQQCREQLLEQLKDLKASDKKAWNDLLTELNQQESQTSDARPASSRK